MNCLTLLPRTVFMAVTFVVVMSGSLAQADSEEPTRSSLEISGDIDVSYQTDFSDRSQSSLRLFDSVNNAIRMQWAEVSLKKKTGPLTGRLDLAFGEMADRLAGLVPPTFPNDPTLGGTKTSSVSEPTRNIPQAFFTYQPTDLPEFSLTAGKFYDWVGLETVRAKDNWNYSRSLTFNYGVPLWHVGLGLGYKFIPSRLAATLYVVNGWDGRLVNEANKSQTFGFNLSATPLEGLDLNYNMITGNESLTTATPVTEHLRQAHNLNAVFAVNEILAVAADLTIGFQRDTPGAGGGVDARWLGWALYGRISPIQAWAFSLRYEEFDDKDGAALSRYTAASAESAQRIFDVTATLSYRLAEALEGRIEYRIDKSNKSVSFTDASGNPTDSQNTLSAAFLAAF